MSLYNGPARGGTRGGRDQFKWDDVKSDKDRENYLGHSVMAPVGRWQKNKDLFWYNKTNKEQEDQVLAEKRAIKEHEEQMMREALGLAPKRERKTHGQMDERELAEMLKRGAGDDEPDARAEERMRGIGNTRLGVNYEGGEAVRETLPGINSFPPPPPLPGARAPGGGGGGGGGSGDDSDSSRDRKRKRKDEKKEKKEKKKLKKLEKKLKKEEKKAKKARAE